MRWRAAFFCGWLCLTSAVEAGDRQRESDYQDQLQRTVSSEQVIWLTSGGQGFIGLLTEAEKTGNAQAAIVLHDFGGHPDLQPLVHGLRTLLPQHHWTALAIQLPLREVGAGAEDYYGLFDEGSDRIQAAIAYLRDHGAKDIALVGVGVGAAMAAYKLSLDPQAVFGLVAISLPMPDGAPPQARTGDFIHNIALPILDIYAEFDWPDVSGTAGQRRLLARDNPGYRQIKIQGETHAYRLDPNLVIKRVYSWLALQAGQN